MALGEVQQPGQRVVAAAVVSRLALVLLPRLYRCHAKTARDRPVQTQNVYFTAPRPGQGLNGLLGADCVRSGAREQLTQKQVCASWRGAGGTSASCRYLSWSLGEDFVVVGAALGKTPRHDPSTAFNRKGVFWWNVLPSNDNIKYKKLTRVSQASC